MRIWAGAVTAVAMAMSTPAGAIGLCENVADESRVLGLSSQRPEALVERTQELCRETDDGELRTTVSWVAAVGPGGQILATFLPVPLEAEQLEQLASLVDTEPGDAAALAAYQAEHGFAPVAPTAPGQLLGLCMPALSTTVHLDSPGGEDQVVLHLTGPNDTSSEAGIGVGRDPDRTGSATVNLFAQPATAILAVEATLPYMTGIDDLDDYGHTEVFVFGPAELPVLATCFPPAAP